MMDIYINKIMQKSGRATARPAQYAPPPMANGIGKNKAVIEVYDGSK